MVSFIIICGCSLFSQPLITTIIYILTCFFKEGDNLQQRIKQFLHNYKHGFVILIYAIVYTCLFALLEQRNVHGYHIVHTLFDDYIPFCEYFIVPYLLWFPYQVLVVLYFIFRNKDRREYYQLTFNLMMGMTIFLIVSYVYPNGHLLRPTEFARDNLFVEAVKLLYRTDTATNILPSIHVFNSLAIHMSVISCKALKDRKGIRNASLVLTILIILSTMFLKQHSFVDVSMGTTLALAGYLIFYREKAAVPAKKAVAKKRFLAQAGSRRHKG